MPASTSKRALSDDDEAELESESECARSTSPPPVTKASRGVTASSDGAPYRCTLPPICSVRPSTYATHAELENHYRVVHQHACPECHKIFPDDRYLTLHITETHDPIALVRHERGERIFRCFETTCARSFMTPKKRRLHLIDLHKYPKEFYFQLPKRGLNDLFERYGPGVSLIGPGWTPRASRAQAATATGSSDDDSLDVESPEAPPTSTEPPEMLMTDLSETFAAKLSVVPAHPRFGHKAVGSRLLGSGHGRHGEAL